MATTANEVLIAVLQYYCKNCTLCRNATPKSWECVEFCSVAETVHNLRADAGYYTQEEEE